MSGLRSVAALFVLFALVSSVSALGAMASAVESEAVSAVEGAEAAVAEAFGAVVEAERAGGNVSELLDRLDLAAEYLATANMCLRTGEFDGAVRNASLCVGALEGLAEDAAALRDTAAGESGQRLWITTSGSIVGVVMVVCGGFVGWRWSKKRYYRQALKMKPEVADE